jgi:hypothetical protein
MVLELNMWATVQFARKGLHWPQLWVQSGHRSFARQRDLNPEAPDSLHTRCPSQAVDLRIGNVHASISTFEQWAWLGSQWKLLGGRWGGDFQDPDVNHFDLGVGVS